MSETRSPYLVSGPDQGPRENTLLGFSNPGYEAPTWEDIRIVMRKFELTGSQVADLVGVNSRTVRKWVSPPDSTNHTPMPYAAWRLLLIAVGLSKPEKIDKGLKRKTTEPYAEGK